MHASNTFLTKARTALLVANGYAVLVYTVNEPDRAKTLFGWKVSAHLHGSPGTGALAGQRLAAGALQAPRSERLGRGSLPPAAAAKLEAYLRIQSGSFCAGIGRAIW